jgi:chaperonin cofactor prefoldin
LNSKQENLLKDLEDKIPWIEDRLSQLQTSMETLEHQKLPELLFRLLPSK